MATTTTSTGLFTPERTSELFNQVSGHSALAKLSAQKPIPFAGTSVMVFSMDGEAALVAEAGNKPAGEAFFKPISVTPLKFVYQHRITDEFQNLSDEAQLPYLEAFIEGFAKKMARALDIAAMHGIDPKTKTASTAIGNNCLDKAITQTVASTDNPADDLQDAVDQVAEADRVVTGIAMSPTFASKMGKLKQGDSLNAPLYPDFAFGGHPRSFNGMTCDVNNTVKYGASTTANAVNPECYVGDFENALRWGYADSVKTEIIEFGDPDGQGDLKRTNQIVLRAEAYIGWGILDPSSFAKITSKVEPPE